MTETLFQAFIWLALALLATLISIWFRISGVLSEIIVGTVARRVLNHAPCTMTIVR